MGPLARSLFGRFLPCPSLFSSLHFYLSKSDDSCLSLLVFPPRLKSGRYHFLSHLWNVWFMPRFARTVFAKVPHHITQRGTLAEGDEPDQLTVIQRNIEKGLPCGSESFLKRLERKAGRVLQYKPRGRPRSLILGSVPFFFKTGLILGFKFWGKEKENPPIFLMAS